MWWLCWTQSLLLKNRKQARRSRRHRFNIKSVLFNASICWLIVLFNIVENCQIHSDCPTEQVCNFIQASNHTQQRVIAILIHRIQ